MYKRSNMLDDYFLSYSICRDKNLNHLKLNILKPIDHFA